MSPYPTILVSEQEPIEAPTQKQTQFNLNLGYKFYYSYKINQTVLRIEHFKWTHILKFYSLNKIQLNHQPKPQTIQSKKHINIASA